MPDGNGWIRVEDWEPIDFMPRAVVADGQFRYGMWDKKREAWYDSRGIVVEDVTHWQDPPELPQDPADSELEDILEKSMQLRQQWYVGGTGSDEGEERERLKLMNDTIAEIKAWKDKHS